MTLDEGGRGRDGLDLVAVGPALRAGGTLAWVMRPGDEDRGRAWRVVPDAHPHVILSRYPSGRVRAVVVGARSRHVDVDQGARSFTVGIRLRPGALPALTRLRAEELLDASVRLDELDASGYRTVGGELDDAVEAGAALRLLLRWVRRRLGERDPVDWRVRGFAHHLRRRPTARVGEVAARLGVSVRGLRAVLARDVGLSPKGAQRIARLHGGLALMLHDPAATGSSVAHRAGYTDHAHFIRESRALLGETPEAFRQRGAAAR